jgi:hypothetical protein
MWKGRELDWGMLDFSYGVWRIGYGVWRMAYGVWHRIGYVFKRCTAAEMCYAYILHTVM